MTTDEEQLRETDVPRLRVFRGAEEDDGGDDRLPDPTSRAQREWARCEAFWAGRNRAKRLSARLVA